MTEEQINNLEPLKLYIRYENGKEELLDDLKY